ncbi:MAG: macrolide transporter subunit MacA [Paraburkholderia sp.]|uniref:macrolide transporter subunit MacA n=1 Tax=Paraburkholderia sp. TaxID=1926495 RepID=UPI003C4FB517
MKAIGRIRSGVIGGITVLILLGALFMFLFNRSVPSPYVTAKVEHGDLDDEVLAVGTLQATRQVDVGAQVSGQVNALTVKLGDHVKKGQLLAEIDPVLAQNALRQAQAAEQNLVAQVGATSAQLIQARSVFRSQEQMLADEATARQDYEAARAQMDVQRANLESLDAQIEEAHVQVETAKANLGFTRITAPMDGEVVAIVTQQGQTVIAQQEAPVILKLAVLDTMTVKAQVPEADVIRVHPGQDAYFTILGDPDKRYAGRLRSIEPVPQNFAESQGGAGGTDPARVGGAVFYAALFDVPNPDHRLRIAMTAQTHILLQSVHNALMVPLAALGERNADGTYPVRIREGGAIRVQNVHTGIGNEVNVQILGGLHEGDEVVIGDAGDADASGARD